MRKGFTLIELLVVITILGILVSATSAIFNSKKFKAGQSLEVANQCQLQGKIAMWNRCYSKFEYCRETSLDFRGIELCLAQNIKDLGIDK